jgi:hypothetical protein
MGTNNCSPRAFVRWVDIKKSFRSVQDAAGIVLLAQDGFPDRSGDLGKTQAVIRQPLVECRIQTLQVFEKRSTK